MRYLLLFLVIIFGVILWRRAARKAMPPPVDPKEANEAGAMVQCRVCGVYLPQEDSVQNGAFHYCSEEHRKKDAAA